MPAQLTNYLGTGSDPRLRLTLADNAPPKWNPFTIDYGQFGDVPHGWSAWNISDENGNYYGTVTLTSDGTNLTWKNYVAGKDGYYLEDIALKNNQLSVGKIYRPNNSVGPFPDAPRAQPASVKLRVRGADIVDNFDRKINFKGVVRPSLEWDAQGQFLNPEDIKKMASWGSNVIRLDLNQDFWFKSADVSVKGSYKQIIDAIIYYATQNRMAVILDLHWLNSTVKQAPMANQDSLKFWQEVATTYKDFGTVIFELYNEPYGISSVAWRDGYQQMLDVVRATGANNPVIVNGLDWGYDLSFVNANFGVQGTNIIYGSHPYAEAKPPQYCPYVYDNYPVIFTEFGDNDPRDYPFNYSEVYQRILEFAGNHGVHYTGFAWWVDQNNPAFPTLISDWEKATPVNGGVLVHDDMQKNPASKLFQAPVQLAAQSMHPLASYLAVELTKIQDVGSQNLDIAEILRQCLKVVLQPHNNSKFLIEFIGSKRDEIKELEQQQHCWPFGFFCATPVTDQLDNLLEDVKAQTRTMAPQHHR